MTEPLTTIYVAGAVRDANPGSPVNLRPGAVAVCAGNIEGVGEPDEVEREARQWGPCRRVDMADRLILPGLVNAHAHLDLTDIGPVPYDAAKGFIGWVEMLMRLRPQTDESIADAVRHGLQLSRVAGVTWIGDIAGSDASAAARLRVNHSDWVHGVNYLECFGMLAGGEPAVSASRQRYEQLQDAITELEGTCPDRLIAAGLQPHAPYSAGRTLFALAGSPTCGLASTHLAETREEIQFVRDARGPFADFLRKIGKWDGSFGPTGRTPVQFLAPHLANGVWMLAHCNYVDNDDLTTLAQLSKRRGNDQVSVAYCPIASDYFGHRTHRYREMLEAGINVCLGTDSILCQPDQANGLSILAQMRYLYRRDRADPSLLLEMATTHGAEGMMGEASWATLSPPTPSGLLAIRFDPSDPTDALTQVLLNDYPVEPLTL